MTFVDNLRQPGDNERIEATCRRYENMILSRIHSAATAASKKKQNRITGYLQSWHGGLVDASLESLGHSLHSEDDPMDFKYVYTDINCTGYNTNDPLLLTKEILDQKVLSKIETQLRQDGFRDFTVRCDQVDKYVYQQNTNLLISKFKKLFTGEYGLYIYVDIRW